MIDYLVRRLLYAIPIVLGVTLVTFILFNALVSPETAAAQALGGKNVSQKDIDTWMRVNGYDLPTWPFWPTRWRVSEVSHGGENRRGTITWRFDAATGDVPPATVSYRVAVPPGVRGAFRFAGTLSGPQSSSVAGHSRIAAETEERAVETRGAAVRILPPRYEAGQFVTVTLALNLQPSTPGEVLLRESVPLDVPGPMRTQFGRVCWSLLTLQFGYSHINKQNINEMIWQGMWPSFMLTLPSFLLGTAFSIVIGLFVAYYRGTYLDLAGVVICVVGMSVPILIYIIFGQYLLGIVLNYFPVYGYSPGLQGWRFFLMPVLISVAASLGGAVRLFRTVFVEQASQDYVRTARAKGVPEPRIMARHVLPNAMIPILTVLVIQIPYLFLGSLLLERYFGIPGLGARTLEAIVQIDYPVLRAMVFIGSLMFVVGNVLTDISYTLFDPRVRLR